MAAAVRRGEPQMRVEQNPPLDLSAKLKSGVPPGHRFKSIYPYAYGETNKFLRR